MVQACWDWGENGDFAANLERPESPPKPDDHRRNLEWQTGPMEGEYMERLSTEKVLTDLGNIFGLSLRFRSNMTLDGLLKLLLGQRLDDKLHALSILESYYHETAKGYHSRRDEIRSRGIMRWLQDSMELQGEPRNMSSSQRPRHPGWGGNLARTWDLLTRDDLHGDKVDEFFSPSPSLGSFWRPVSPATRANWAPLLDLVRETRERLFPLQETFTAYTSLEESLKKFSVNQDGWEKICVV
ncbi:uncharacterized protein ColSpa_06655 [Colletotrichum spaethianum]|uniref:Uncharacterized protein n=1 Tax=Colletotrichum spaethianum TaxID=700344 RepID=A0AA37P7Z4_9PEZI|nr:uncharacterized protein ColSpa_06655 [Colletotrichum spaethianum]GKT46474.1 hypothetical protein ColSpa_06655 [Colletotrichum spaethianum]